MIVSHKNKYLFIEIPLTGSWAVRNELCEFYDGAPILHKHASYPEFRSFSKDNEGDYFVFAAVRNPLDAVVSHHLKLKTNHKGAFTDAEALEMLRIDQADLKKYKFIQEGGTFEDYFLRYHRRPYCGMIDISRDNVDFIMRHETLQEDFSQVLERLGLQQVRAIPVVNRTSGKRTQWPSYYTTDILEKAKLNFGPFMQQWGYGFPDGWGDYSHRWPQKAEYVLRSSLARLYLVHFRYGQGAFAKLVRHLRAFLMR